MIDFHKLHKTLTLDPGERITVEANGVIAEMTADTLHIKGRINKATALQTVLTAEKVLKETRRQLVDPVPDMHAIKQNAGDLIDAGELLKRWAEQ